MAYIDIDDLETPDIDTGVSMRPYHKFNKDQLINIKNDILLLANDANLNYKNLNFEDFNGGTNTSGQMGKYGWSFTNGNCNRAYQQGHPSMLSRTSSTSLGVESPIFLSPASSSDMFDITDIDYLEFSFRNLQSTNNGFYFGIFDNCAVITMAGAWFGFDTSVDNYFSFTSHTDTTPQRQTFAATIDTAWHIVRIFRNTDGSFSCTLDNETLNSSVTYMPPDTNGYLIGGYNLTRTGGISKTQYLDWVEWKYNIDR